jgi:hypothetical protein
VIVEIERERDHLAFFDKLGGGDDVLRARVIERADLVIRPPFAPVFVFLRGRAQIVPRNLLIRVLARHRRFPSLYF